MAELDNLPEYATVAGKLVNVATFEQAIEVGRILGDDNEYGIHITDPIEEQRLIQFLFGGTP